MFLSYFAGYQENIEENKNKYLNVLDPYNHGNVNFTDAVAIFGAVYKSLIIIKL